MILAALVVTGIASAQDRVCAFEYRADPKVQTVSLAGTFNGWNKFAHPMTKQGDGRTWKTEIRLSPGEYQYKFVVDNDRWVIDPAAKKSQDDGTGNVNSYLVVLPPSYAKPAKIGDGEITESALRHEMAIPYLNLDRGKLSIRLDARAGDIEKVILSTSDRQRVQMRRDRLDALTDQFVGTVRWNGKSKLGYTMTVVDGSFARFYAGGPNLLTQIEEQSNWISPEDFKPFVVPSWVEKTVFYQIFPDRFANGDKRNDPKTVEPWTAQPSWWNRFGGDAAGIRKHLGYLKDLGIDGLYINPIMAAPSNHRYDPSDFYRVDPEFGTNQEFGDLTKALLLAGIRTVLDQTFDHSGVQFEPFVDLLKNQASSKYKDWFMVKSYPVEVKRNPPYEGWNNAEAMPKLNVQNPAVRKHLLDSVDYWMKNATLAGWRLDVAGEMPSSFWREFRPFVKARNPEAWICGEVWERGTPWLSGDQFDATMNYPFRGAVIHWLVQRDITASQFVGSLSQIYNWTVPQVSRNQLNLLSSHDTERFLTLAKNDQATARLAATVQFTWPGTPSIYYGEELGMEGGKDPDNRRPMRWDLARAENPMLAHYKKLISLRRRHPVLQSGDPVVLSSDDAKQVAVYGRELGPDTAIVALNRSNQQQQVAISVAGKPAFVKSLARYRDGLAQSKVQANPRGQKLTVTLAPKSAAVLLPSAESTISQRAASAKLPRATAIHHNPSQVPSQETQS